MTNMDSLQYELKVHSFNTGSVEQYILWKKDLEKLIIGQNLELASDKFTMTRKVLKGNALAVFNHMHMQQVKRVTILTKSAWKDLLNTSF